MTHEAGMKILWDVLRLEIIVIFRGNITILPRKFDSCKQGIEAGEQFCRDSGWIETGA